VHGRVAAHLEGAARARERALDRVGRVRRRVARAGGEGERGEAERAGGDGTEGGHLVT